ncbi:MAG: ATP phosphoribosyltransferase [Dehalococcoidales bacterium]
MSLKIALPKGKLLTETAALLDRAGWGLGGYQDKARLYRLKSQRFPKLSAKIFHEKDIPIQVAVGNYDIGICGRDWVEELMSKYPSSAIVCLESLGYGDGALFAATAADSGLGNLEALRASSGNIRIASEYPNLAESLATQLRLRWFSIYPLWGSAEAYPPDSAELVLLPRKNEDELSGCGLMPVARLLDFRACLIANRYSLKSKDMAEVIASISDSFSPVGEQPFAAGISSAAGAATPGAAPRMAADAVKLALPDGHQQPHVRKILDAAGVSISDYPSETGNRRPQSSLKGVAIKVIRPQDMPLQVANGNFDLAVTGRDWLTEHRYQFPSSPAVELVDLKYGRVRIVAVVSRDVPAEDTAALRQFYRQNSVRVASEYVNIADHYARLNHLGNYRVIPTWGATEAFLPEDADLLIENTETGGTIARHNLKIIETLFESTACLIGNKMSVLGAGKSNRIKSIIRLFEKAVEGG